MAYYALIPAAGIGTRMEHTVPKQYLSLAGHPVIWHALRALCASTAIERVFVVLAAEDAHWPEQAMASLGSRLHVLRCGGQTRAQSVLNGLRAMALMLGDIAEDWVLVHDAARPFVTGDMIDRVIDAQPDVWLAMGARVAALGARVDRRATPARAHSAATRSSSRASRPATSAGAIRSSTCSATCLRRSRRATPRCSG